MSEHYVKAKGELITSTTFLLALFTIAAFVIIAVRFLVGLGPVSGMSDGYPWGVWLAYDLAVGGAFASGGFVLAFICYVLNGWKYHPMMRTALVASLFGYTLAGFSVVIDIGRYWNIYGFFLPSRANVSSIMLMVALCMMCYIVVLFIELLPAVLERLKEAKSPMWRRLGEFWMPKLDKILFIFIALGLTIPFMQQSSYGSMWMLAGHKLHPLWQTPMLPLLFFLSAALLGSTVIVFESSLSSVGFKRPYEKESLGIARIVPLIGATWLAIRFVDLIVRGQVGTLFSSGFHSIMVWIELGCILYATIVLFLKPGPRKAFFTAIIMCIGGAMFRLNTFLIGYDPGPEWFAYFPTIPEFLVSFGFVALEVMAYIILARVLRLLPKPHASH